MEPVLRCCPVCIFDSPQAQPMFSGDWPEQPGQPFTPSHPHLGTHLSFALLEVGSCPLTCLSLTSWATRTIRTMSSGKLPPWLTNLKAFYQLSVLLTCFVNKQQTHKNVRPPVESCLCFLEHTGSCIGVIPLGRLLRIAEWKSSTIKGAWPSPWTKMKCLCYR